jgi:hypothetical protein
MDGCCVDAPTDLNVRYRPVFGLEGYTEQLDRAYHVMVPIFHCTSVTATALRGRTLCYPYSTLLHYALLCCPAMLEKPPLVVPDATCIPLIISPKEGQQGH